MKSKLILCLFAILFSHTAHAHLSKAEIAYKQFAVFDQLLASKKITESFGKHLESVSVKREGGDFWVQFNHEGRNDGFQYPTHLFIETDLEGEYKRHKEITGSTQRLALWPGKTPAEFLKIALDYVLKSGDALFMKQIRENLRSVKVTPNSGAAIVDFQSDSSRLIVRLHIDAAGVVNDYPEIIDL